MNDLDGKYAAFPPLIDGALLRQNPARMAQMASELARLGATRTEADAIMALADNGGFSSVEIAIMIDDALARAREPVTRAAGAR